MVLGGRKTVQNLVRLDGTVKQSLDVCRGRLLFVAALFSLVFFGIIIRIVDLGFEDRKSKGKKQNVQVTTDVKLARGNIVDRNGDLLATNLETYSLYANAKDIMDAREAVDGIASIFPDVDDKALLKRLSSGKGFVWIKRNLHPKDQQAVNSLGIPGLYFKKEQRRVYPNGDIAAHVLGMVGVDGHGLSGLEKQFDKKLITASDSSEKPLELSIDLRVQGILHDELMRQFKAHKAKGAAGIVMDAKTGEIIAMESLPGFDPNIPEKSSKSDTFNRATLGIYEMGSTFKTFTLAMALDAGIISMDDSFDATSPIKIAKFSIDDYHAKKRWLTVPEIFMYSSNIGTAKIADSAGPKLQRDFLKKLGMFSSYSLEIPERATPIYPNLNNWSKLTNMTVSYGHGMAVTPVHVASAMSAIVNGGVFMRPTLIKGNIDKNAYRVMKERTSNEMKKLLRLVVEEGTGKTADVEGYMVGGKTGTADKARAGKYSESSVVASFVGVFPMDDPRYVVLTLLDDPKATKESFGYITAGYTAAPVAKNVIARMGPLLNVKPVNKNEPSIKKKFLVDYKLKDKKLAAN